MSMAGAGVARARISFDQLVGQEAVVTQLRRAAAAAASALATGALRPAGIPRVAGTPLLAPPRSAG